MYTFKPPLKNLPPEMLPRRTHPHKGRYKQSRHFKTKEKSTAMCRWTHRRVPCTSMIRKKKGKKKKHKTASEQSKLTYKICILVPAFQTSTGTILTFLVLF